MRKEVNRSSRLGRYLLWAFLPAYALQGIAYLVWKSTALPLWQLVLGIMMFVPALAFFLSGGRLSSLGWKPQIRKNLPLIAFGWLAPMALALLGAALYFLVFPGHLDLSGDYIVQTAGQEAADQLSASGLTYPLYVLVSVIAALTYAPLLNTFVALGEEIGWRGYLYPELRQRFGQKKGQLLGGLIWGAWHWPAIWLVGYEYGAAAANPIGYFGFPFTGVLVFCLFTVSCGILCDWLYERGGTIWLPSLLHGAVNAAFALPLAVCLTNTGTFRLLGPAPNGLIAGIPLLAVSALVFFLWKNQPSGKTEN